MDRLQEETAKVEEHLLDGSFTTSVIRCFTTAKANSFENLLEPLQKLLRLSPPIALSLADPDLFYRILQKLQSNKAVVRLNLLRIIRSICDASDEQGALIDRYGLTEAIHRLAENDGAVLVRNMAAELVKSSEMNDNFGVSSGKRRPARRSSSSNTPPSALGNSYSMPSTPTTGRSGRTSNYFLDREARQRTAAEAAIAYRPVSRDRNGASRLPMMINGAAGSSSSKTPAPRPTPSTRTPQRQAVVSPKREENVAPRSARPEPAAFPAPNSRRRRHVSGEMH